MAIFRPQKEATCELNFDDKFTFTLPIHEDTIKKISTIADAQLKRLKALKTEDDNALDEAYNSALDAIDDILGEGASDEIMSIFEKPGLLDAAAVVTYIAEEYSEQYQKTLGAYKAEGKIIPSTTRRGRK
jgi:hypothetical protein